MGDTDAGATAHLAMANGRWLCADERWPNIDEHPIDVAVIVEAEGDGKCADCENRFRILIERSA